MSEETYLDAEEREMKWKDVGRTAATAKDTTFILMRCVAHHNIRNESSLALKI